MFPIKHIVAFGRILLVFILVANSGFTFVLHTCQMPDMSCCEASVGKHADADRCDHDSAIAVAPMPSICCQFEVVGGVDLKPISTDRPNDSGVQRLSVVATIPQSQVDSHIAPSLSATSYWFLSGLAERQTVDRYVLNTSFLI